MRAAYPTTLWILPVFIGEFATEHKDFFATKMLMWLKPFSGWPFN
jgi:hypothetical protein